LYTNYLVSKKQLQLIFKSSVDVLFVCSAMEVDEPIKAATDAAPAADTVRPVVMVRPSQSLRRFIF